MSFMRAQLPASHHTQPSIHPYSQSADSTNQSLYSLHPRPFSPITPMKKQVTTVITILKRSFKLNLFSRLKYFFNNLIKVLLLVMPVQNPKAHHRRCLLMQLTLYHFRHFFCLRQTARTANSKQPPEYAWKNSSANCALFMIVQGLEHV